MKYRIGCTAALLLTAGMLVPTTSRGQTSVTSQPAPRRMIISETSPPTLPPVTAGPFDQLHLRSPHSLPAPSSEPVMIPLPADFVPHDGIRATGVLGAEPDLAGCLCVPALSSGDQGEIIGTWSNERIVPSTGSHTSAVANIPVPPPVGPTVLVPNAPSRECLECKEAISKLSVEIEQGVQQLVALHQQDMPYAEHAQAIREQLDKLNDLSAQRTAAWKQLRKATRAQGKTLGEVKTQVAQVHQLVEQQTAKLDAGVEQLSDIKQSFSEVKQTLEAGRGLLTNHAELMGGFAKQLAQLQEQMGSVHRKLDQLTEQQHAPVESERVSSELQQDHGTEATEGTDAAEQLQLLQQRLDEAVKRLAEIQERVQHSSERLEKISDE